MSVTVKRVDRKSSQRFYELIVETAEVTVRVPFNGTSLTILRNRSTAASTRRIDRETFIKFVLLILLSTFVLFMLGLVLSIVLLDDFLNDDN